jgi:hypothetical protein
MGKSVQRVFWKVSALGTMILAGALAGCGSGGGSAPSASNVVGASLTGSDSEAQLLARALIEKSHAIADIQEAANDPATSPATGLQSEATPKALPSVIWADNPNDTVSVEEKRRALGSRSSSRLSWSFSSSSFFGSSTVFGSSSVRVFSPPVFVPAPIFFPSTPLVFNPVLSTFPAATPVFGLSPAFWSFQVSFGPSFVVRPSIVGSVNYTFLPTNSVTASPSLPGDAISFAFSGVDVVLLDGTTSISGGSVNVSGGLLSGFRLAFDRWRLNAEALVPGSSAVLTNAAGQQVTVLVQSADPTRAVLQLTYGANTPVPGRVRTVTAVRQPDGRIAYSVA